MSDELKPCPFCGGEGTWKASGRGWAMHCEGRFGSCLMNARTHYQPTKDQAIAAWNTRATPKVKPLEWKDQDNGSAGTMADGGVYLLFTGWGDKMVYCASGQLARNYYHTLEEAKAAAQADYERRILEALE